MESDTAEDLIPSIVMTVMCTIGAVGSARFANKVTERKLNLTTGTVLILVSVVSVEPATSGAHPRRIYTVRVPLLDPHQKKRGPKAIFVMQKMGNRTR